MNVTLAMVMSLDGKTTRWDSPEIYTWTSAEDQSHFFSLIASHNAIIMGKNTYEASKKVIRLTPEKLRIVLTSEPASYAGSVVPGQLEFFDSTPEKILSELESRQHSDVLLVGGSVTNARFLEAGLVNELWVTIEPRIFGQGQPLVSAAQLGTELQLESMEQLNDAGTILLKYKVV
ncbi:dihydrofolate reductase family protein [Candidatus Woesebacteria bacterium]|nr:dihydrofolate reductase family protein [Candidatus Woesebacteria bacterium]